MKKSLFILFLMSNLLISQNNIKKDLSQPTIDVVGKAIVKTIPDEVTINVQLENKGKDPQLLKQNQKLCHFLYMNTYYFFHEYHG